MKKNITALFSTTLFVIFCFSCKQKNEKKTLFGEVFGSYYSIIYYGDSGIETQIDSIFQTIDKSLSTYRTDSEISLWNSGNDSIKLSEHFIKIANLSLKVYNESNGYFDPTVKTIVEGWGFGNGKPSNLLSNTVVNSLMKSVGFDKLEIKSNKILKQNKKIQLDFNSIAPGYTSDLLSDFFLSKNIKNFIIDIGGEIVAKGENLNLKSPWKVGIDNPSKPDKIELFESVFLKNESLAVSGNYRKIKIDSLGRRIVHTINPKTGYPQSSNLLSVTVITDPCALADAYATSCMVMGVEKSKKFLKKKQLKSLIIYESDGKIVKDKINNF